MEESWPNGLHLYENALIQKQSKKLYNFIDNQGWDCQEIEVPLISRVKLPTSLMS